MAAWLRDNTLCRITSFSQCALQLRAPAYPADHRAHKELPARSIRRIAPTEVAARVLVLEKCNPGTESVPVNLVVKGAGRELGHLVDIFADPCRTLAKVNVTVLYYADVSPQAIDLGATIGCNWDDTVSAKALRSFDERGPIRCVSHANRGRRASGKTPERLPQFVKSTLRPELIPQQVIPSSQRRSRVESRCSSYRNACSTPRRINRWDRLVVPASDASRENESARV